jgi:exonuclease SbcD
MVGRDVAVPPSVLLDPAWDYVALGHIHKHQNLNPDNNPPIVYPGSLERVDFGEEGQPKGFCWVELQRGQADWRYIKVPARPFLTIRVDVRTEAEPLPVIEQAVARHDLSGAVVRLIVAMSPEQEPQLRDGDIATFLKDAFFAQINRDVDRTVRDRLGDLEPELMTPERLLQRYFLSRGRSEAELDPYIAEARKIFHEPE